MKAFQHKNINPNKYQEGRKKDLRVISEYSNEYDNSKGDPESVMYKPTKAKFVKEQNLQTFSSDGMSIDFVRGKNHKSTFSNQKKSEAKEDEGTISSGFQW